MDTDIEQGYKFLQPFSPIADDIVIPAHLIRTLGNRAEWTPDAGRQTSSQPSISDPRETFDAVDVAIRQRNELQAQIAASAEATAAPARVRGASITMAGLARSRELGVDSRHANDFTVAGPRTHLRKTSLPAIFESNASSSSKRTSRQSFANASATSAGSEDWPPVPDIPVEALPPETILYNRLSDYNLSRAWEAELNALDRPDTLHRAISDPIDPLQGPMYLVATTRDDELCNEEPPQQGVKRSDTEQSWQSKIRKPSVLLAAVDTLTAAVQNVAETARRSSLYDVYENAKQRGMSLQRKRSVQIGFEYAIYLLLLCFIYFVLIGRPIWNGAVWWLYWVVANKFVIAGTWSITIGLAMFYAYSPLFILFEREPPMPEDLEKIDPTQTPGVHNTALLIPCYKSENIIGPTLEAAIKVFPPSHIFVIANGNSVTPLDKTEDVVNRYGANHIWSPIGSKIVAQFVGCYAAKHFTNVLLIDDDCALPPNFPIVSERMVGKVKCIGYTIKSVGPESSKGTLCQRAQDMEYKLSGLQRALAGKLGSATFPHGAISLWDTGFLIKTFHTHPGFSVSEDWFFGHVARQLGCRIKMCTAIFVETETPTDVFFSSGGARGGFGEMTIFKQRFYRWNFFFVNGMWYNMAYIFGSWKLGWWEIGAKLFVFQEVYETLLYLLAPFVLPISFIVRPEFCGYLMAGTFGMYIVGAVIFNEVHLRLRRERIDSITTYVYYMPFKIVLTVVSIASCYYSLYKYAKYFAKRHPKVIEDEKAVEVVLRLEEKRLDTPNAPDAQPQQGRRMTVTAIGSRLSNENGRLSVATISSAIAAGRASPTKLKRASTGLSRRSHMINEATDEEEGLPPAQPPAELPVNVATHDFASRKSSAMTARTQQQYPLRAHISGPRVWRFQGMREYRTATPQPTNEESEDSRDWPLDRSNLSPDLRDLPLQRPVPVERSRSTDSYYSTSSRASSVASDEVAIAAPIRW